MHDNSHVLLIIRYELASSQEVSAQNLIVRMNVGYEDFV